MAFENEMFLAKVAF